MAQLDQPGVYRGLTAPKALPTPTLQNNIQIPSNYADSYNSALKTPQPTVKTLPESNTQLPSDYVEKFNGAKAANRNFTMQPNYEGTIAPGKQLAVTGQGITRAQPGGFTGPTAPYQGFSPAERAGAEEFKKAAADRVAAARAGANSATAQPEVAGFNSTGAKAGGILSRAAGAGKALVGGELLQAGANAIHNAVPKSTVGNVLGAGTTFLAGDTEGAKRRLFGLPVEVTPPLTKMALDAVGPSSASNPTSTPASNPTSTAGPQPDFKMPNMLTSDNVKQSPSLNEMAATQNPAPASSKVDLGNGNYVDDGKARSPESVARMQGAMTPSTPGQLASRAESARLADQRYADLKARKAAQNTGGQPQAAQGSSGPDYSGIINQALETLESRRPTNSFDDAITWKHKTANAKAVLDQIGGMQKDANSNKSNENINNNNRAQRQAELDQRAGQDNIQNGFESKKIDLSQSNLKATNETNALERGYQRTKDAETAKREQARIDLMAQRDANTPKKYTLPSGDSFNGTQAQYNTQVKYEGRTADPEYKKMVEVHGPEAADAGYLEFLQTQNR